MTQPARMPTISAKPRTENISNIVLDSRSTMSFDTGIPNPAEWPRSKWARWSR